MLREYTENSVLRHVYSLADEESMWLRTRKSQTMPARLVALYEYKAGLMLERRQMTMAQH